MVRTNPVPVSHGTALRLRRMRLDQDHYASKRNAVLAGMEARAGWRCIQVGADAAVRGFGMSIQALAWALDQPVPGTAGRVLISLGNHADHINGFVHFDAAAIARESVIGVTSLWRYLGALERNGYIAKDDRKTQDGDKREYWLALDRDPSLPWSWSAHDVEAREDDDLPAARAPLNQISAPPAFDKAQQDEARQINAQAARKPDDPVPIIEGSRAHRAWCAHLRAVGRMIPYSRTMIVNGRECRGFPMPTLFPPGAEESAA